MHDILVKSMFWKRQREEDRYSL